MIKSIGLKIDGEEFDEELPFEIREDQAEWFKEQLQLAKVAQRRMQESAEARKSNESMQTEFRDFLLALKENPREILSDPNIGIDLKNMAEQIIAQEMEEAAKPEEVKAQEALERKIKELEDAKKKAEDEAAEAINKTKLTELKNEEDRIANQMQHEIVEAMKSNDLPDDPEVLSLVAKNMKVALKYGVQLSVKEIVPLVKKELYDQAKKQLAALTDNELADFIGSDRLNTIRKSMIKNLRKSVPSTSQIKDQGKKADKNVFDKKNKGTISQKEYFKNLSKQYR
jgi:hypothetical protein